MKKNKEIMYIKKLLVFCSVFSLLVCVSSCGDDSEDGLQFGDPRIVNIVSLGDAPAINEGFPEELVRVEGTGLNDMKEIVFDGAVSTFFNSTLNSNVALFFNVPFDDDQGSRFGNQTVTFTNLYGESVSTEFTIKQPAPTLAVADTFLPSKAEAGVEMRAFGNWFFDVEDVLIDGESVGDFTVVSSQEILFTFPEGKTDTTEFTVVTSAGMASTELPIEGGFITYLISDFDGNGAVTDNDSGWAWFGSGDFSFPSSEGVDNSGVMKIEWDGTLPNGNFVNLQTTALNTQFSTTGTDPENAFVIVDINHDGAPGTRFEIVLNDNTDGSSGSNWAYHFTIQDEGWQTLEIPISEFGFSYNPSDQGNGDLNPSDILQIKMGVGFDASVTVPSRVLVDNFRIKVLE